MRKLLLFGVAVLFLSTLNAQKVELSQMRSSEQASLTRSIDCPTGDDVVFSQASATADLASTSNSDAGYAVAQHCSVETIASLRFFGLNAFNSGGWATCGDGTMTFDIKFYADSDGVIGEELTSYATSVELVGTATGDMFASSFPIYYWDWTPDAALTGLPADYYISVSNAATDCWFMWYSGTDNISDDLAYSYADGAWTRSIAGDDVSYAGMSMCVTTILADANAPAVASDVVVTPGADGALTYDLSFTNPSETFGGETLTELTSIIVKLDGEEITGQTWDLTIGGSNAVTGLTVAESGFHAFSVTCVNSVGEGPSAGASAYIGEDIPGLVTDLAVSKVGDDYVVTWVAPTEGANGAYFAGATSYIINRAGGEDSFVADTITETTYTDVAPAHARYTYSIQAVNAVGTGAAAEVSFLAPAPLPFMENFDASTSVPDLWEGNMYVSAAHGNNSNGLYKNVWSSAPMGEITLPTVGPIAASTNLAFDLRFVAYSGYPSTPYELVNGDKLEVFVMSGSDTTLVHTIDSSNQVVSLDFAPVIIDLGSTFEGQDVVIKLVQSWTDGDYYIDLDNFNILNADVVADIEVKSIAIPEIVGVGSPISVVATIVNNTLFSADTWGVEFTTSDGVFEQVSPTAISIPALGSIDVEFDWTPAAAGEYSVGVQLSSLVNDTLDVNLANNYMLSDTVTVTNAIVIGDGIEEEYNPINFYWKNSVIENIYTAEEMGGSSNITSIKYQYVPNTDLNLPDSMPIKIWVGETDATDLSAGPINAGELAMVFDGVFPNPQEAGLVEFMLDAPYVYAGGNFVVLVQHPMAEEYYSGNYFLCDEDTTIRTVYAYSDSEEYDPYDLPTEKLSLNSDITAKKVVAKDGSKEGKATGGNGFFPNIVMEYNNDPVYNVAFTVTDGSTALEGATVVVTGKVLTTDASGEAATIALDGTYEYTVNLEGYFESTGSITVAGADVSEAVTMTLIPTFTVSGVVNSNAGDVALEGAEVSFADETVVTGADGMFSFTDYVAGDYEISISAAMHGSYSATVTITDADVDLGTITLEESINAPAGLLVEVDSMTSDATFSWGNISSPLSFTDDFEGYDDFVLAFDPWTLNDVDGLATYGFNGVTFPNSGAAMAGIIFNPSTCDPDLSGDTPAYSGDKYLAVFNPDDASACNDWVISPMVAIQGGHEVSFMARGGNASYSEEVFQVFVSTTGTDVADFEALSDVETCAAGSAEWVAYSYDLSAYAGQEVYVALHVTSVDQFYFCLDDFYVGPASKGAAALESYNVFLNDMETAVATGVTDMEYVFAALEAGSYTAGVQSVYTSGVSEISTIDFEVVAPTYTATLTVTDGTNTIEGATVTFDGTEYTTDASGVVAVDMLSDGDYAYTVTAEGYVDNSGTITIAGADVAETITMVMETALSQSLAELVNVYPNPATSYISIDNAADAVVEFYNIAGAKVLTNENLSNAARIDVSELEKGVYFVTITKGNENVVERIVIE